MTRYRARWVLPIDAPPIPDGIVAVDDGRVARVGRASPGGPDDDTIDLGSVALLPAFVNAHAHLELSHLRGRVAPAASLPQWVRGLMRARAAADVSEVLPAIGEAVTELARWGTAAVGDVSNTLASVAALDASGLDAVVFHELIGFAVADGEAAVAAAARAWPTTSSRVRLMIAAHAPYSVSPSLLAAVARWLAEGSSRLTSIHLGESPDEIEWLAEGRGPWRTLLEELGVWQPQWSPPRCGPVAFAERCGLGARTLVVHGVHLDQMELARLAEIGSTLVCCPRSNRWTGVGDPPLTGAHAAGVRTALGTDSLASGPDLGMPGEIAEARRVAPRVPPGWLLKCATLHGAQALGLSDLGALRAGAAARMITVDLPSLVEDVEEYLVGGLSDEAIRWVNPPSSHHGAA